MRREGVSRSGSLAYPALGPAAAWAAPQWAAPYTAPNDSQSPVIVRSVAVAALAALALAVGVELAQPFRTASIAFDSQVAVLDFARLTAGRQVEAFLSTTPKPLLTFVFGPLELLTRDWRSLAWATLGAFALGVVLMAELAHRFAGRSAWLFVGIGLAGSGALLFDVGYALAVPWAMLGWAVAGLAISRPKPCYGLAGIALMLATLARLESILIVALSAIILIGLELPPIARVAAGVGIRRPPRRAWLILVGFGALPVMVLHDLLIYGDPLFWASVAVRYSASTTQHILGPAALLGWLIGHYLSLWPLVVLGLLGVARLVRQRTWIGLVGWLALGPGMAIFLLVLAVRRIYVPDRYVAPIDIAAIVAAGVGTAWVLEEVARQLARRLGRATAVNLLAALIVVGIAIAGTWPSGILNADLHASVQTSRALAGDLDEMLPSLRSVIAEIPGAQAWGSAESRPPRPPLLVPAAYQPRLSVDLDTPLTLLGGLSPGQVGPLGGDPGNGRFLVLDRNYSGSSPVVEPYETAIERTLNGIVIIPIASNPNRGWWIIRLRASP
jgi:hypothetical protein